MSYVAPLTLRFNLGSKGARAESAVTATAKPTRCVNVLGPWLLAAPVVRDVCARRRAVLLRAEWRFWASLPCHHPPHEQARHKTRGAHPPTGQGKGAGNAIGQGGREPRAHGSPSVRSAGQPARASLSARHALPLLPAPLPCPPPAQAPRAPCLACSPSRIKLPTPGATKLPAPIATKLPSSPCEAPRWFRPYGPALWAQYRGAGLPPPAADAAAPPASFSIFCRQGVGAALWLRHDDIKICYKT